MINSELYNYNTCPPYKLFVFVDKNKINEKVSTVYYFDEFRNLFQARGNVLTISHDNELIDLFNDFDEFEYKNGDELVDKLNSNYLLHHSKVIKDFGDWSFGKIYFDFIDKKIHDINYKGEKFTSIEPGLNYVNFCNKNDIKKLKQNDIDYFEYETYTFICLYENNEYKIFDTCLNVWNNIYNYHLIGIINRSQIYKCLESDYLYEPFSYSKFYKG